MPEFTHVDRVYQSTADDIRKAGWAVAVHNDYRLNGKVHTFWLFTKPYILTSAGDIEDGFFVKGEGESDTEALNSIRRKLGLPLPTE